MNSKKNPIISIKHLAKSFGKKEVLRDINLLFNKIMNVEYGGVNYSKGHEFVFGNLSYNM